MTCITFSRCPPPECRLRLGPPGGIRTAPSYGVPNWRRSLQLAKGYIDTKIGTLPVPRRLPETMSWLFGPVPLGTEASVLLETMHTCKRSSWKDAFGWRNEADLISLLEIALGNGGSAGVTLHPLDASPRLGVVRKQHSHACRSVDSSSTSSIPSNGSYFKRLGVSGTAKLRFPFLD